MSALPEHVDVTLVNAETYVHFPTRTTFRYKETKTVPADVAEYLHTHAVKEVKVTSGGRDTLNTVQLFEFSPVDVDADPEDEDVSDAPASTLADTLSRAAVVTKPSPAAVAAPGAGQARSRGRGQGAARA